MKYNGFVTMFLYDHEVIYEFKDGHFEESGLLAKYRLAKPKETDMFNGDFVPIEGKFPFRGYEHGVSKWFILELRFVF